MNKKILYIILAILFILILSVILYFIFRTKQNFKIDKNTGSKIKDKKVDQKKVLHMKKMRQIQKHKMKMNSLLRAAYLRDSKQVDTENVENTIIGNNYFLPDVNFLKLQFPSLENKIFKENIYIYSSSDSQSTEKYIKTFSNDNILIQRSDLNDINTNYSYKNNVNEIIDSLGNKITMEKKPIQVVNVKKTLNDTLNTNSDPDFLLKDKNDSYFGYNFDFYKKNFNIYMIPDMYSNENNINPKFLDELAELVFKYPIKSKKDNPNFQNEYTYIERDVNNPSKSLPNNVHVDENDFIPYLDFLRKWGSHIITNVTFGKSFSLWEIFNKELPGQYSIDFKKRIDLCKSRCSKFPNPDKCLNNVKETFEYFENFTSTPTPTPTPTYPSYYSNFSTDEILAGLTPELLQNPNLDPISYQESAQNIDFIPQNCEVSDWEKWSECSVQCGGGKQNRIRRIIKEQKYGGIECPDLTQTRECNTDPCPINCEVGQWGEWGDCSVQCGGGSRTRNRQIVTEPKYGGTSCPDLSETETCNTNPCPINCEVSDWSEWNKCSEDCDGGSQTRTRTITKNSAYGGETCPPLSETQDCNTQPCINCDSKFCSTTDYKLSYNNYCVREECINPYSMNINGDNVVCSLNIDDYQKSLLEKPTDYIQKLFKIKELLLNNQITDSFTQSEIDDAKKLPTMKTINLVADNYNYKDLVTFENNCVKINNDTLNKLINDNGEDKPISYDYKPIWELIKELYLFDCLTNNMNEKYIYGVKSLSRTCLGKITDISYKNTLIDKYQNIFANPNLPVDIYFSTTDVIINKLKDVEIQYVDIKTFNTSYTDNIKEILGTLENPMNLSKISIATKFKLKNESYSGNGYNIRKLITLIPIIDKDSFIKFDSKNTLEYIFIFGNYDEKIEDINIDMIILDQYLNKKDLKFNLNSSKDPSVYYSFKFENNNLFLDIKFSLEIPLEDSDKTYTEYFYGQFQIFKDKIMLVNTSQEVYGNKITNRQFFVNNNLTQIKKYTNSTSNGTLKLGNIKQNGILKSIKAKGILNKSNTIRSGTELTFSFSNIDKKITVDPTSTLLENGMIISLTNVNKKADGTPIIVGVSDNKIKNLSSSEDTKWIINSEKGGRIVDGDTVTLKSKSTGLFLYPDCKNVQKIDRISKDFTTNTNGNVPDYVGCNNEIQDVCSADKKCYTKCNISNKNFHSDNICSKNCISNNINLIANNIETKWKIFKIKDTSNMKGGGSGPLSIYSGDVIVLVCQNNDCQIGFNLLTYASDITSDDNIVLSTDSIENWNGKNVFCQTPDNAAPYYIKDIFRPGNCKPGYSDFGPTCYLPQYSNSGKEVRKYPDANTIFSNGSNLQNASPIDCNTVYEGPEMKLKNNCSTNFNTNSSQEDSNTVFLDRQNVNCYSNGVLNGFHLGREGNGNWHYEVNCVKGGNLNYDNPQFMSTPYNDEGRGNSAFLDRHNVDCGNNKVITQFKLSRSGGGQYKYDYTCIPSNNQLSCREVTTEFSDNGGGNAVFLDRKYPKCQSDEAMSKFVFENSGGQSRYRYTCCKDPNKPFGQCNNNEDAFNQNSSKWNCNFYDEREFIFEFNFSDQNLEVNKGDEIIVTSNATNFELYNLYFDIEVEPLNFISVGNDEIIKKPEWFDLIRSSLFSYDYDSKGKNNNINAGKNLFINTNELLTYFPKKGFSEFTPFPIFDINTYDIEFLGFVPSSNDNRTYEIFNKFCKQDTKRVEATPPMRVARSSESVFTDDSGKKYYDIIYFNDDDLDNPKNIIEIMVPEDQITIAHDSCSLLQGAYNLEAAYIFSSKTFCPYTDSSPISGAIQKIITKPYGSRINTYGCWNMASGCQSDSDCSGNTKDEHINHKDSWYGRGVGWIPTVRCPNSRCPKQQGIGFASWCDNSPTWPWNLKLCGSDKDCGKDGEQWGGFCYPKCRDGYHNTACCICTRNSDSDQGEYDRVSYCTQTKNLFHETKSSPILGNPTQYRTVSSLPLNVPEDGTGKEGQYSCAADNARVNNLNELVRNSPQVEAPCKCQNPYTIPGKNNQPENAVWNILPDRLIWDQLT